jgi:transposase
MVVDGWTYPKIYHLQELYFTISTLGKKMVSGSILAKKYSLNPESIREKKEVPSLLLCDSQAVDNTDTGRNKGFCFYKNVNGIKRHTCVDTLGNLLFIVCTSANVSDDKGLVELLSQQSALAYFKSKPVNTKKITILLDNGYHKEYLERELTKVYPQYLTKIKFQITPKPTADPNNPGFKPVHKRWVVERTNSWFEKCRILLKNVEKTFTSSVTKLQLCSVRLQVRLLAKV